MQTSTTDTDVIFTNVAAQFGAVCESQEEEYKTELNKLIIDPSVEIEHVENVTALHTTWSHLSELESSLRKMVGCIAAEVNSNIVSTLGENFQAELSQQEIGSVRVEIIEDLTILHGSWSDLQKAENFIWKKQDSRPGQKATKWSNADWNRLQNAYRKMKSGQLYMLTADEEKKLADYLTLMSERNSKRAMVHLGQMAYCILPKERRTPRSWRTHKQAGKGWCCRFLDRHPSVSLLVGKTVGLDIPSHVTPCIIETFYNTLAETTARLNLSYAPERIYNCDTTTLAFPLYVFPVKYDQICNITMMACGNAAGHLLPPVVIFEGENTCHDIRLSAPDNWYIRFTEDGCLRAYIFEEWFEFVFVPSLGPDRPVLLLLDTYRSRETLHVVEIAKKEQIEILMFPLNTTKLLQPINIFLFNSTKEQFRKETELLAGKAGRAAQQLETTSVCPILDKVLQNLPPSTLSDGFRETGISPYKRLALTDLRRHMIDKHFPVTYVANVERNQQMPKDASQQSGPSGATTLSVRDTGRETEGKKIISYNRSRLKIARDALMLGKFSSLAQAADVYSIPIDVLNSCKLGRVPVDCTMGVSNVLTEEEEDKLADYVIAMSQKELKRTEDQVRQMAYCIAAKATTAPQYWTVHKKARSSWFLGFLYRHQSIPIQCATTVNENSKYVNSWKIETFYNTLSETMAQLNISKAPERIYNCDSTQIPLDVSDQFSEKYCKSSASVSATIKMTSLMICGNAAGRLLPPIVIFQEKNTCNDVTISAPDNWYIRFTEDGCLRADIFEEWFEFVFVPSLGPERPVLLLLDTYRSRETLHVLEIAKNEQIEILMFPLYTTNLLQPLNVSLFGFLKEEFEKVKIVAHIPGSIDNLLNMTSFCTILHKALEKLPPSILVNGFRKTGISPYRPLTLRTFYRSKTDEIFYLGPVADRPKQQQMPNIPQQSNEPSVQQTTDVQKPQTEHLKRSNTAQENRAKKVKTGEVLSLT